MEFTEPEKRVIRILQGDLEPAPDVYARLAEAAGVDAGDLQAMLERWKASGALKRIGAVVRHGRMGFTHNVMVAMQVAQARVASAGEAVAAKPWVSHCYEREVPPAFPYNLFAMVHATSREEAEARAREAAGAAGTGVFKLLWSLREVKKASMRFF